MRTKTKKRKRHLRLWVKVVIAFLIIGIGASVLFPILKNQSRLTQEEGKESTKNENVETRAVVMIDPGHGGMDGGAISETGKAEKEFALEFSLKIGEYIHEIDPSIEVIYTRKNDETPWVDPYTSYNFEYDDLVGRSKLVNDSAPNYLLSIHFNSQEDESEYGYEAYVRKDDTASDTIYSYIAQNLEKIGYSQNRGCWSTETYPLQMVDLTSPAAMLLELGFMTNENDVHALLNPTKIDEIAKAIAQAYCKYIDENPNPAPHIFEDPTAKDKSENSNDATEPNNSNSNEMEKEQNQD